MTLPAGNHTPEDLKWFRKIYDLYYTSIRNYVYFKTANPALSDDIVQETFIKFWEHRKKVRPETVKPLLYTIATNLIKNEFKHNQVVYKFERNTTSSEISESADHQVLSEEFNARLQKVLAEIPENARIVFLMNRIEGLTYSEIAARLNLSVKAIEKRMSEAISILRSKIEFKV